MSRILRENFTKKIYQNIVLELKSINIFGEKGIGKSRFINDLLTLIQDDIKVVHLDIRSVRNSYDKFINQIKQQLDINEDITLSQLLGDFDNNYNNSLLILDNFEELYKDNADSKYNFDFFNELNSFKNRDSCSLIIISSRNYTHHKFYNNNKFSTSPLDLPVMEIVPLTLEDIEAELRDKCDIDIKYDKLANMIIGNKQIYNFIRFIIREIEFKRYDSNANLYMNYEAFKEQFHKENNIPFIDKMVAYVIRHFKEIIDFFKYTINILSKKSDKNS